MTKPLIQISIDKFVETIVAMLLNKFDCFIIVEGMTGTGKSTLVYQIAKKVNTQFKLLKQLEPDYVERYYELVKYGRGETVEEFIEYLIKLKEEKRYRFVPERDLIYSQDEMLKALSDWRRIIIPDEMINVTFNRDFFSENQKNIIKLFNMHRDHNNLVLACVPRFSTLDNQIQNLCKVRFTVVRRGIAILQTPNKTIYGRDRWDSVVNEKIEREWLLKKDKNPKFARLTTVRGIVKFKRLNKKSEEKYQTIKDIKRSKILVEEMEIKKKEEVRPIEEVYKRLLNGNIKSGEVLKGVALSLGMTDRQLKDQLRRRLEKEGMNPSLTAHYSDKKSKDIEPQKENYEDAMYKFSKRFEEKEDG